jgi:phosphate acetyltransferase
MLLLDRLMHRARQTPARIVLCESEDPRVLKAAAQAAEDGLAHIILVGDGGRIRADAQTHACDIAKMDVVDPRRSTLRPVLAAVLLHLRQKRGMTKEQAETAVLDPLTFAMLMLREGHADGSVAGAVHTTADVVRGAIQIVGIRPGVRLVSSFFLMLRDEPFHTSTQAMIFSDCGLVIDPNAEELAEIALAAADSARTLLDTEPKLAMLSFSTSGSAQHVMVDKVRRATELVRARQPDLAVDGEIQLDAAIVPGIAERKIPESRVAGQANVLIFPNLDVANICYKLTERLGHAVAIGPLLQGLNKPANDLSRGCSSEDVYNVIALTVLQSQTALSTATAPA